MKTRKTGDYNKISTRKISNDRATLNMDFIEIQTKKPKVTFKKKKSVALDCELLKVLCIENKD